MTASLSTQSVFLQTFMMLPPTLCIVLKKLFFFCKVQVSKRPFFKNKKQKHGSISVMVRTRQISGSPEQTHMSEQLENTPGAPNFWFTTPQISNLQPGGPGTSPHRPPLNGPFTHEELLRSSENYFLGVHHLPSTCRRNLIQFMLPVMWERAGFWPTSRQLGKPWKTLLVNTNCEVVLDEITG